VSRRFRTRLVGVAVVSACGFTASTGSDGGPGGVPDDSVLSDAAPDAPIPTECTTAGTTCVGPDERLRMCSAINAVPVDTVCAWRCANAPTPHCRRLQPSGGAVLPTDLDPAGGLGDVQITSVIGRVRFNTDTGAITNGGLPVSSTGSLFVVRNGVGIWRFNKLTLNGVIELTGNNAAALVAITEIQITGLVDLQGDCDNRGAGPGGGGGGDDATPGGGSGGGGAGSGSNTECSGGGGGGHAVAGGSGGDGTAGGAAFGTPTIAVLAGGGGGGGGGGSNGGDGGGGGGAIQLVANGKVRINGNTVFGIQAGGCGGRTGASCGGGAGAGGTILIEAGVIEILNATLAVNGGGGGGGKSGTSGNPAHLSTNRASGGIGGTSGPGDNGGGGGAGGDNDVFPGQPGGTSDFAGGGGGAVGRMRFNTLSGTIMRQSVVFSPNLSMGGTSTPVTQGMANLE